MAHQPPDFAMRPKSIVWFERLFFASFALTALDLFYHWDYLMTDLSDDEELGAEFAPILIGVLFVAFAIQIILWYFIAHRASRLARTVYIVFWVLGLFGVIGLIEEYMTSEIIFMIITQLVVLGSVIFLYQADVSTWLNAKGQMSDQNTADLPEIFK